MAENTNESPADIPAPEKSLLKEIDRFIPKWKKTSGSAASKEFVNSWKHGNLWEDSKEKIQRTLRGVNKAMGSQREQIDSTVDPTTSSTPLNTSKSVLLDSEFSLTGSQCVLPTFEEKEQPEGRARLSASYKPARNLGQPTSSVRNFHRNTRQSMLSKRLEISNTIRFTPRTITLADSPLTQSHSSSDIKPVEIQPEDPENYNGERLLQIHRDLKNFDLSQKAERQIEARISDLQRKMKKDLSQTLLEVHLLSKKIQILDAEDSKNIEHLSQEKIDPEQTTLSYKSQERILNILKLLRTDPHYLVHSLYECGFLEIQLDTKSSMKFGRRDPVKMARVIIISLFRTCISPDEDNLCVDFMIKLCEYQIEIVKKSDRILPFFLHFFSFYVKFTGVYEYLTAVLQPFIMGIVQDKDLILDLHPERQAVLHGRANPHAQHHLATIVGDFFQTLLDALDSFPLQLRKIISFLFHASQKKHEENAGQSLKLIKQLIFDQFFLQALLEPKFYLQLVGVDFDHSTENNILQLHQSLLAIDPTKNTFMQTFLMALVLPDAGEFKNVVDTDPQGQRQYLFTKSEWEMIFQLLEHSRTEISTTEFLDQVPMEAKLKQPDDPLGLLVDDFLNQTRAERKYSGLNPRKFIKLEEAYVFKSTNAPPADRPSKEARKSFIQVLSDVSFLPRFQTKRPILDYLSAMGASDLNKDKVSLLASSKLLITSMQDLPQGYKAKDFSHFLDLVEVDIRFMRQESQARVQEVLHTWDQMQHCFWKISSQKRLFEDYFTGRKIIDFKRKVFGEIQNKWGILETQNFCQCKWSTRAVCQTHQQQSVAVKDFISQAQQKLRDSVLWKASTDEEIYSASIQLERSIMGRIHNFTFAISNQEDNQLNLLISQTEGSVDLEDFAIPKAFHHEAPWVFAQVELSKMNQYTAPFDKLQCLSRCWQVISRGVSLLDDAGPDACLSIMLYVIYAVDMKNNWGNLLYIECFSSPLDPELMQGRTGAMRTALRGLATMLQEKMENKSSSRTSRSSESELPLPPPECASDQNQNLNNNNK